MRDSHPEELSDFLRARRSELRPSDVGLPNAGGLRRVRGLRREEVSTLASISIDYYTRLEQGRIHPSPPVLASMARALRLDAGQTAYLFELAGAEAAPPADIGEPLDAELHQLQAILDDLGHSPAFAIGPRTEVVAWNRLATAVFTDFAVVPESLRYYVRLLVTDPAMRVLYADWPEVTQLAIAQMRRYNAVHPDDPQLTRLVAELSAVDADFRQWWSRHTVAQRTAGAKHLRHPIVGDLHLHWSAVTWNADPDIQLILWTAEPGSESFRRLTELARLSSPEDENSYGGVGPPEDAPGQPQV